MFAVIPCRSCRRRRVVDLNNKESSCPWCGFVTEHKTAVLLFTSRDPKECREAQNQMTGFGNDDPDNSKKKEAIAAMDPLSTLAYEYEHTPSIQRRIELLAEKLTFILGSFTYDDIAEIDPKNAKNLLRGMIEQGLVAETSPDRYSA